MNLDTERKTQNVDAAIVKQLEEMCGGPEVVLTKMDEIADLIRSQEFRPLRTEQLDAIDQFSCEQ